MSLLHLVVVEIARDHALSIVCLSCKLINQCESQTHRALHHVLFASGQGNIIARGRGVLVTLMY
jgi:hypothetical protein